VLQAANATHGNNEWADLEVGAPGCIEGHLEEGCDKGCDTIERRGEAGEGGCDVSGVDGKRARLEARWGAMAQAAALLVGGGAHAEAHQLLVALAAEMSGGDWRHSGN
jgi:hypothetical protein